MPRYPIRRTILSRLNVRKMDGVTREILEKKELEKVVNYWFRETDDGSDTEFSFVGPHGLVFFERARERER